MFTVHAVNRDRGEEEEEEEREEGYLA